MLSEMFERLSGLTCKPNFLTCHVCNTNVITEYMQRKNQQDKVSHGGEDVPVRYGGKQDVAPGPQHGEAQRRYLDPRARAKVGKDTNE